MAGSVSVEGPERPTLLTWLKPPANEWAFRHARELFWSEKVPIGAKSAPRYTNVLDRFPAAADHLEHNHVDALVVLKGGEPVAEWYRPGVFPEERHILFSVTKSVVGYVASCLIVEGVVDDDELVSTYIPEALEGGYGDATVRQLLSMTASVDYAEDYNGPDVRRFREASGQLPSKNPVGVRAFACQLPKKGQHGEAFAYISPTTDMATWVCERATGATFAELLGKYVWGPMDAEHEGDMLVDRFGGARGSGGLCATARDMARIGGLLLSSATTTAADVASRIRRGGDRAAWDAGTMATVFPGGAYSNFWYQPTGDPGVLVAGGIHQQWIYVDTERDTVIAQQASYPTPLSTTPAQPTFATFSDLAQEFSQ